MDGPSTDRHELSHPVRTIWTALPAALHERRGGDLGALRAREREQVATAWRPVDALCAWPGDGEPRALLRADGPRPPQPVAATRLARFADRCLQDLEAALDAVPRPEVPGALDPEVARAWRDWLAHGALLDCASPAALHALGARRAQSNLEALIAPALAGEADAALATLRAGVEVKARWLEAGADPTDVAALERAHAAARSAAATLTDGASEGLTVALAQVVGAAHPSPRAQAARVIAVEALLDAMVWEAADLEPWSWDDDELWSDGPLRARLNAALEAHLNDAP